MENNDNSLEVMSLMNQSVGLNVTKATIEETAEQLLDKVRDGELDLLHLFVGIKALAKMEEYIKDAMLDGVIKVKDAIRNVVEMQGEGKLENRKLSVGGVEYELMDAGVSYDYSNDPVYRELKAKIDARVERLKKCRVPDAIRGIKPEVDENGIELYPPLKKSTPTFKVNFKKSK